MANFEQLKIKYDNEHQNILAVNCFLPVHLTYDKQETSLYKKDGSYNEQYTDILTDIFPEFIKIQKKRGTQK